ncbi:TraR/DksA family transcriptional regulator [Pelomonas aquatica]|jgi:DnaK suppressor protein|uniref:TraR/DksA family transcriptional regulator n=1 Tax=Pelomonas aquatica TaxID=431058 RepID=A0A9X4LEC1_9BURK|nr:TraR/DksA C4-type zinc finger protein [Pelomonas aquatica]MCY4754767.1 TraR/DksA C4-type zinc finger protein [Pelomonas aquatica]MDG0861920.1 TraR/DksA family transcriptional regulator [Pelomonas aquatica]
MNTRPTPNPPTAGLDIEAFRLALRTRRAALRQALRPDEAAAELAHEVSDLKDAAARSEADGVEDEQQRVELAELRDVEAALRRLEEGRFGLCASCAEAIPVERLRANPSALRCTACQAAHEAAASHH